MLKSVEIPQDIIDSVIDAVGDDAHLLKTCALVSSSFLLPSRKHLFSRITLKNDQTCQRIHQFLVQNRVIQSFVRSISLTSEESSNSEWMNGTSLLAILGLPFPCLECFSIRLERNEYYNFWYRQQDRKSQNWDTFSSELKDMLSSIVHLPTLKTLSLKNVSKVPISFFLHIVHLTTLKLHSFSPIDFGDENSSSLTLAASKGEAPMASHRDPVIDRCLWRIEGFAFRPVRSTRFLSSAYLSLIQEIEGPTKSIFLPFMRRLRFFEISIELGSATMHDFNALSFLMGSLCISLASPATLEHLQFNIWFSGKDDIGFSFREDEFYDDLRDAEAWSHLDSIITHPAGSQLQRVDINIYYSFCYDEDAVEPDEDEVEEAVLHSLPLLRAKGILFVEASESV